MSFQHSDMYCNRFVPHMAASYMTVKPLTLAEPCCSALLSALRTSVHGFLAALLLALA